jgi:type IV secretory pathway component VirB8
MSATTSCAAMHQRVDGYYSDNKKRETFYNNSIANDTTKIPGYFWAIFAILTALVVAIIVTIIVRMHLLKEN